MTIRARNKLFFIFFIASIICAGLNLTLVVFAYLNKVPYEVINPRRTSVLFAEMFPYRFSASLVSILMLNAFVCISSGIVCFRLQKNQATELIYFMGFLLGCLFDTARILVPLNNTYRSSSLFLHLIDMIVVSGKTLTWLCMMFAAFFSGTEYRQSIEKNLCIVIFLSLLIGQRFPVNTLKVTTTFMNTLGYTGLFVSMTFGLFAITLAAMLIQVFAFEYRELKKSTLGYTILAIGYTLSSNCDNYVFLVAGFSLFASGICLYLRSIHEIYLWR